MKAHASIDEFLALSEMAELGIDAYKNVTPNKRIEDCLRALSKIQNAVSKERARVHERKPCGYSV